MGNCSQCFATPCGFESSAHNALLKSWWTPRRQGPSRHDFLYSYEVPPKPGEQRTPNGPHQYIQSEGKLTFKQYKVLVKAVHDEIMFTEIMIRQQLRPGYDPFAAGGPHDVPSGDIQSAVSAFFDNRKELGGNNK